MLRCLSKTISLTSLTLLMILTLPTSTQANQTLWQDRFDGSLSNQWEIGGDTNCIIETRSSGNYYTPSPDGGGYLFVFRPEGAGDCWVQRDFQPLNQGTIGFWFYDNNNQVANPLNIIAAAKDNNGNSFGVGVRQSQRAGQYVIFNNNNLTNTNIARSKGWHYMQIKRIDGNNYITIDGNSLQHLTNPTINNYTQLKIVAGWANETASTAAKFDQINVGYDTHRNHSLLWGKEGELYNPTGRLPDYSYAGYHAGEKHLPNSPITTTIDEFGAYPNDGNDDTTAFVDAINQMKYHGITPVVS